MKWDESKHPRDEKGRFTTADFQALSIDELVEYCLNELNEQKQHKEIVPITDKAIERVPLLIIPGYSEEECRYIMEQHKELLRYARDNNNHCEVAFIFRDKFSEKYIRLGSEDTINMDYILTGKGNNVLILHNHPRNGLFSLRDLDVFANNECIKTMSIVRNNGQVDILYKTDSFSKNAFLLNLVRNIKRHIKVNNRHETEAAIIRTLDNERLGILWIKNK